MSFDITFLQDALRCVKAGDTVLLKNGLFDDVYITINNIGTESKPVTIRPEIPGGLIISGNSSFNIAGSHITFTDFKFQDTTSETVLNVSGNDIRISSCEFKGCVKSKIIIGNSNNRFDHCVIDGINEVVMMDKHNLIDHSVFCSGKVLINANEGALYNNILANGIVENHGHKTVFLNNTFSDKTSKLNVQEGDDCLIFKNSFLVTDEGVHMTGGSNSTVCKNIFVECSHPHHAKKYAYTLISTNEYIGCGSNIVSSDEGHVHFTNNKILANDTFEGDHHFDPLSVSYSSNMCFTHAGHSGKDVAGIIHMHANSASEFQKALDYGHDDTQIGFLTPKWHLGSTQLFKTVEEYNAILRHNIHNDL